MIVTQEYVDIPVNGSPMRMFVAAPKPEGKYPAVLFYSDIFQLTGPMIRSCLRLAGYGFVVAAPEIYHRLEAPGTVIPFDDAGRIRGLENALQTRVAHFDTDCRGALDYLNGHPKKATGKLTAAGFCIGGHLAMRAALQPDVLATVCFYPTGVHTGKLGKDEDAATLPRLHEIQGRLLLIFGDADPHIPEEGRIKIDQALRNAGVQYRIQILPGEHAFMRDEGPRYDPESTDLAFQQAVAFLSSL